MRVFISQPMNGKTYAELENERNKAIEKIRAEYPDEDIKVVNKFFTVESRNANPLWCLGRSLENLSTADLAFFAEGWNNARGCRIEFICACEYGIKFITVM